MPIPRPRPLSFGQQRLWFATQLAPPALFRTAVTIALESDVDPELLERALREVVRRHEVLRSGFEVADGVPVQRVDDRVTPTLETHEIPVDADEQRAWAALAASIHSRELDLTRPPLLRACLVRHRGHDRTLLVSVHRLVCDGASAVLLAEDVAAVYRALAEGAPPRAAPSLRYRDFAAWQRRAVATGELDDQLAFWLAQLLGVQPLDLPLDRPRPQAQTFRRGGMRFALAPELVARLDAAARQEGASRFVIVLAAFQALLSRLCASTDVAVAVPVAARTLPGAEHVVGVFANTLVIRSRFADNPTFRELVARGADGVARALANRDVPFEQVVKELHHARDGSASPLERVAFSLDTEVASLGSQPGVSRLAGSDAPIASELALALLETRDGRIGGTVEYSADLFDEATIARLVSQFQRVLSEVLEHPRRRVIDLPLLSDAERRFAIETWNETAVDFAPVRGVHELVAEQAHARPNAIAVVAGAETLDYGDLERRARELAARLRAFGVARGSVVAVMLDRSPALVVALYGILKSGGAYLPLEPSSPPTRSALAVADSGARVLVTSWEHAQHAATCGAEVVLAIDDADAASVATAAEPAVDSEQLAYVVYTSGSTGAPKGVEVTHGALWNLVQWHLGEYALGPDNRTTQLLTPAFDVLAQELWPSLAAGASVHLVPHELRYAPELLAGWLRAHEITDALLPPSVVRALLDGGRLGDLPIATLHSGGERVPPIAARSVPFRLAFAYGLTETTVVATVAKACETPPPSSHHPIGRPIANVRVYLLDEELNPVEPGRVGEIYVGGAGIARGYRHAPAQTALRFVPDPFVGDGRRLYRTGDLGRHLPDGQLEFLGRNDAQVKIRGFRVEPGEVEAVIRKHARARDAAVVAAEAGPGATHLVAFVGGLEEPTTERRLLDALRERLPEYMLPARVHVLDRLPTTATGKLDTAALASLAAAEVAAPDAPPLNATERAIAELWGELTGHTAVSADDNFFAIGGDSLLAMQLLGRLRERFQVELTLPAFFEAATVSELAALVDASPRTAGDAPIRRLARVK